MSSSFECDLYVMLAVIISAILFSIKKIQFIFFCLEANQFST